MFSRYVLRALSERDREQWDGFVSTHSCGHFLQSWGWGELKASSGWYPLRLALWDEQQEQVAAAAQVLLRAPLRQLRRLGNLAYIPRGPVLDWSQVNEDSQALWQVFFDLLHPYLRKQGALALRVELPQELDSDMGWLARTHLQRLGFQPTPAIQPARTILLDLAPDEDILLAQMKEKWRYNIRLAGRKGVTVRAAQTREDVQAWYQLLQVTGERDHFGFHVFDYYWRAFQLFVSRNQACLLLAEYEGHLLAGIFIGCVAGQAMYLYGASGNQQRQLMPNYLLQWAAIRWAKSLGARVYDFWGIPATDDPTEAMAGVYRFKSGWGGRTALFAGNHEFVYRPALMRFAK